MDLQRLLLAIKRKLWLIIFVAICSSVLTGVYSVNTATTMYQTETSLYIMKRSSSTLSGEPINLQDIAVSRQLITDYGHILLTRAVLDPAIDELSSEGVPVQGLGNALSVNLKKDSNIMSIVVTWPDAAQAIKIANAVSHSFIAEITRLTNNNSVGILDEAKYSYMIPTNHIKNIITSFLLGAFLVIGVIYIREFFDNTIRTVSDVDNHTGLKIIGVIPDHNIS